MSLLSGTSGGTTTGTTSTEKTDDAGKVGAELESLASTTFDDLAVGDDDFSESDDLSSVIQALQSRGLRLPSSDLNVTEFQQRQPIAAFKNREIARFAFAGFEFREGMLYVYTADEYVRFVEALNGLPLVEQSNIVAIDLEALARVESPVKRNIARGSLGTTNIVDPRVIK